MARQPRAPSVFETAPVMEVEVKKSTSKLLSFQFADVSNFKMLRKFAAVAKVTWLEFESRLKMAAIAKMIALGISQCRRPDNFIAVEGTDECTIVFSQRSGELEAEEIALLGEYGIMGEVEDIAETFFINPDYLKDPKKRAKLEAALGTMEENPLQRKKASKKTTVGTKTIDAIFAAPDPADATRLIPRDPAVVAKLLPVVMILGFRPAKDETTDVPTLFARVMEIMERPALKDKMIEAVNDPEKVLSNEYGRPKKKKKAA